jgi:hypothetical protein
LAEYRWGYRNRTQRHSFGQEPLPLKDSLGYHGENVATGEKVRMSLLAIIFPVVSWYFLK